MDNQNTTEESPEQFLEHASKETARIAGKIGETLVGEDVGFGFSALMGTASFVVQTVMSDHHVKANAAQFFIANAATAAAIAGLTEEAIKEAMTIGIADARDAIAAAVADQGGSVASH